MARTPTWAQLRLDAARLAQLQKDCYRSVHHLLDTALPELDEKISLLNGRPSNYHQSNSIRTSPIKTTTATRSTIPKSQSSHFPDRLTTMGKPQQNDPHASSVRQRSPIFNNMIHMVPQENMPMHEDSVDDVDGPPQPDVMIVEPIIVREEKKQKNHCNKVIKNETAASSQQQPQRLLPTCLKQYRVPGRTHKKAKNDVILTDNHKSNEDEDEKFSLNKLEHLKPLPLPLCEYYKRNRPHLLLRATKRALELRREADRRKYLASTRILNSLEQVRISSRASSGNINSRRQAPSRDQFASLVPQYRVKCKLSEHEMKRLTAKTYKRLPEVKRRRNEELSNHMKVQNYKNRLEYGRKLTQNRKHGIINYPLRSLEYTDTSMTSSQSDFSLNGNERAADTFIRPDPYY